MYSQNAIEVLTKRIGFGSNFTEVSIDAENKEGTSGRLFSFYHKLVTLKNLYDTVNEIDMNSSDFNEYLNQLKEDAAKGVLVRLLDLNEEYLDSFDYSDTIISRPEIFEDAYGYTLAINAIEQMVSTPRVNDSERSSNLAYNKLKMEIEGVTDSDGRVLSKGLNRALEFSIKKATDIIFPPKGLIIDDANFW